MLPPITFSDVVVGPSRVPTNMWKEYFEGYMFRPQDLVPAVEKAQRQVETIIDMTGSNSAPTVKVLEGLAGREEVKQLRKWTGLQKVPAVIEMVKAELEANVYDKIVLFGVHKAVLQELRLGLRMFGANLIYAGTPSAKRDRIVRDFQAKKEHRVLVGQVVAAGTAITLTAAAEVGVVEADWVPVNNSQAIMRCHRIGQTRPVNVRFFAVPGYDQVVQRTLKQKTRVLMAMFDEPENPFDC